MIRRILASSAVLLAAASLSQPISLRAQQSAPADAAIELEALELKSAGRYRESYAKIAKLCTTLAEVPTLSAAQSARLEFLLQLLGNLAHKVPDHSGLVASVDALATRPAVQRDPILRGWIDHIAATHLAAAGRLSEASKRMDRLGYVRDFAVLGPLDNERGSGFQRRYAPELAPATPLDMKKPIAGKKRPVRWRRVEIQDVALADLDLGARLRPSTQSLAYLAFTITSETERELCLRVGTSGSVAVFVHGREVMRRDAQSRPLGFDQDACVFRTSAGKTLVLLKVCTQEGGFAARVRITTPSGQPLANRALVSGELTELQQAFNAAPLEKANGKSAESPQEPAMGAVRHLSALVTSDLEKNPKPGSAEGNTLGLEAFRLAYLFALRTPDDEAHRRDRKFAEIATRMAPSLGIAHYLRAYTLIRRGASNADRDENARRQALEAAITAWPRCAEAMRALANLERETMSAYSNAEEWIRRALAVNPQYVYACVERLEILDSQGFEQVRARMLEDYRATPGLDNHPEILDAAIELALGRNDSRELIALLEKRIASHYDRATLLRLARIHNALGNTEAAKSRLEEARSSFVQSRSTHAELASFHVANEELDEAVRAWSTWLEICPEDASAHLALARIYERQGNSALETAALRSALELNPNLKNERRRLDWLEAGTRAFYDDFTIDADALREQDSGPDADAEEAGDTHYYALRHRVVRAYRNGTTSRYEHILVKILGEEGANVFDVYRPPYGGGNPSVRILEAKVIRKDGSVRRGRLGYANYVDLPPMQVGDWVEIAARVDDRTRTFFGDYFGYTHLFPAGEPVPVRTSRLDLILDPGREYAFQAVGEVPAPVTRELPGGEQHYRYEITNIGRRPSETMAPSILERGPLVRVSTYPTWDAFATWWWNLIRKQTVATPEVRAKVRELVEGVTTLEQKVQRIYDFVVTDIRYKAWEFGVHGYKPYSVGSIYARRFGDCKDKAILMNAMLAEIGVEAFPVLIHAETHRDRDDLTLPMVEHFNHCISYVPAQKGMPARFLDGTAQYHPIDTVPTMDRGAKVLVVRGERGEILDVPWTKPEENRDEIRFVIRLEPSGAATVTYERRPGSAAGPQVRDAYGNQIGTRNDRLSDRLGRMFGRAELVEAQFSDLDKLEVPVVIRATLRVKELAARDGDGFRLPVAFEKENLGRLTSSERRSLDLILSTPSSRVTRIEYVAPAGYRFTNVPDDLEYSGPVGTAKLEIENKGSSLVLRRERSIGLARIGRDQYAQFQELTEMVDRIESLDFRMEKTR